MGGSSSSCSEKRDLLAPDFNLDESALLYIDEGEASFSLFDFRKEDLWVLQDKQCVMVTATSREGKLSNVYMARNKNLPSKDRKLW